MRTVMVRTKSAATTDAAEYPKGSTFKDVLWCFGVIVMVVAFTVALRRIGAGRWLDAEALSLVSWIGAAISLAGVLIAFLIFRRQSRNATHENSQQRKILSSLRDLVGQIDDKVTDLTVKSASEAISDAEAEEGSGGEDLWAEVAPVKVEGELYLTSASGKHRRVFTPGQIPLAVVGALVGEWKKQGLVGKWPLGSLRGAFRAIGKGNHPWYLVFSPPGDESDTVVWKVTRGPGGTDHAVRVTSPSEFQ